MEKKRKKERIGGGEGQTLIDYIISVIRRSIQNRKNRRIAFVLSGIVVFVTTYALILPAITLEKGQVAQIPGLYLEEMAEMTVAQEPFENEDRAALSEDASTEENEPAETEDEVQSDTSSNNDAQIDEQYPDTSHPDDAVMIEGNIEVFSDSIKVDDTETNDHLMTGDIDESEPAEAVKAEKQDTDDRSVSDAKDEKEDQAVSADADENTINRGEKTPEISETMHTVNLTYTGSDYQVHVSGSAEARIPDGATLEISEITSRGSSGTASILYEATGNNVVKAVNSLVYEKYLANTEKTLGWMRGAASYARFFDIRIVDKEGNQLETAAAVDVTIELADKPEDTEMQVVHFADGADTGNEVQNAQIQGDIVSYQAEDLFVCAIAGKSIKKNVLDAKGKNYKVSVNYGADARIPDGAELEVSEITAGDKKDANAVAVYESYLSNTEKALGWDRGAASYARFFDIKIIDRNGEKVEIAAPVDVKIELADKGTDENAQVVHFAEGMRTGDVMEDVTATEAGSANDNFALTFQAAGFSVYGIVGTVIEKNVLASDGHNYHITATYGTETGIPEDAELEVSEITKGLSAYGKSYEEYVASTENVLGMEEGSAGYIRLFDISIVDREDHIVKYQPKEDTVVDVRIELADAKDGKDLSVVHFADEDDSGSLVDANVDKQTVSFEAKGFSVYAITDEDSTVVAPRAIYSYYDENGNRLTSLPSQIIKNLESLTPVSAPQYDNKAFIGWYIYDQTTNSWGEEIQFNTPITILLGNETVIYGNSVVIQNPGDGIPDPDHVDVEVRARYTTNFGTVYFLTDNTQGNFDINQTGVVQDSRKVGIPEGETQTVYTLPDKDELSTASSDSTYTFVGWSMDRPPQTGTGSNRRYNYYTNNDSRVPVTEVTVNRGQNTILYPVYKHAHWLNFRTAPVGAGATYISPAYVENGQQASTKKPEDPAWRGYKFLYWTTTPTFDEETGEVYNFEEGEEPEPYDFNQPINEDVTLYAYWESGYTTYTVIHWKQNVNDNKNTAESSNAENRTYDFEEQEQFEVKIGTVITADDVTIKDYTGFHHRTDVNKDSVSVTVDASGATVYNVYYDRDVVTMKFYDGNGNGPNGGYDDSIWGTTSDGYTEAADDQGQQYALVDGEYVLLTREENSEIEYYYTYDTLFSNNNEYTGTFYTRSGNWPNYTYTSTQYNGNNLPPAGNNTTYYTNEMGLLSTHYELNRRQRTTTTYTWYLNGEPYEGIRYKEGSSNSDLTVYNGLYGQTLAQNGYTWPEGTWSYYNDDNGTTGMSYLGQFVLPDGVRDSTGREIRLYSTTSNQTRVEFFLQNIDGTYSAVPNDTGYVSRGGTFYFSEKYDGFNVAQYRRYTQANNGNKTYYNSNGNSVTNPDTAWAVAVVDGSTGLSGGNYGSTRYYHLEIRYARSQYDILFLDPVDNSPITVQMKDGTTAQQKTDVYYQAGIANYYPADDFEVASTHRGYSFNGRWYGDSGQSIQVFFHDKEYDGENEIPPSLSEAEQLKLWYYTDTSGEKIYTDYVPTAEQLDMTLENGGRQYAQDQYVIYTEMPMHNLPIYAGFSKDWYWIKIDPDGGELNPDQDLSTYFWLEYGDKVREYSVTRDYVEDTTGEYYYHYAEFNESDPDGSQPSPRKAFYSTNETDRGLESDGKHYRPAGENEGFEFVGWYEVEEDGSLTPYNFDTEVTHNLILRAVWREKGDFRVYYSTDNVRDVNGNIIDGLTVTNTEGFVHDDAFMYAENANIVVQNKSVEVSGNVEEEYVFAGWYFNNHVYAPGDVFVANPIFAELYPGVEDGTPDTFIQEPVFRKKTDEIPDTENTGLILDMNGGATILTTPVGDDPEYTVNDEQTQISYSDEKINEAINLPENTNDEVFIKPKSEFLGWAFSRDAKSPVFVAGQRVGIDNLSGSGYQGNGANILYAVWRMEEVPVKIMKVDSAHKNIKLGGGEFTLSSVDGTLTSQVSDGYLVDTEENTVFNLDTPVTNSSVKTFYLSETRAPSNYKKWDNATPVEIRVAYDGTVTYVQADENEGEEQEAETDADGNYIIVVTNKLNAIPVKIVKTDQGGIPLANAVFSSDLFTGSITTEITGEGSAREAIIMDTTNVAIGAYILTEVTPPSGYISLEGPVQLTVSQGETAGDILVTATINGEMSAFATAVRVDVNHPELGWVVTIRNNAGVTLPSTGGPGTNFLYLLGALMLLISGSWMVLYRRRRIRSDASSEQ